MTDSRGVPGGSEATHRQQQHAASGCPADQARPHSVGTGPLPRQAPPALIPLVYVEKGTGPVLEHQEIISYLRHPPTGARPVPVWETASPAMVAAVARAVGLDPVPTPRPKRATVTPEEQAEAERRQAAVQGYLQVGARRAKPRRRAKKAPPAAQVPAPSPTQPPTPEALRRAAEARGVVALDALREYLRLHDRGGHLAPWLRDGKRFRVVDARDQAYARGDTSTREVAGRLLALTREQLEAVRRAAEVPQDIGRVKPESVW